jgi:hypothetical protein
MKNIRMFALAVGACVSMGCATTGDVQIARDEATEASRKADEALEAAREARRLAQDAEARAARSEEMLNRSFKRSMYK